MLAIRIDGGLRAWSISGERREAKKDFNTEVTEGRTRRAQRKEKRGREKPKTQVKNRTWGTRLRITQRSQRAQSSQRREKREEVEEWKRRGNLVLDRCGVEVELWKASPLKG